MKILLSRAAPSLRLERIFFAKARSAGVQYHFNIIGNIFLGAGLFENRKKVITGSVSGMAFAGWFQSRNLVLGSDQMKEEIAWTLFSSIYGH